MLATPRQTMLFSATMPAEISDLADTFLTDPARVATAVSGKTVDKVSQSVHFVEQRDKAKLLKQLLSERKDDLSLVFCRTKHGAEKLMKMLVADGFSAVSVHGNKSQGQRERAISEFRSGRASVLVATDVAARGIDIPGVSHVYNLDLPHVAESYVHRIGRTARAGAEGQAVAFCSSEEIGDLRAIERLMKMEVPVASGEAPAGNRSSKPSGRNGSGARPAARGPKPGHRGQRKPSGGRRPEGRPEVRVDGERPAHADARPARAERPVDANGAGAAKKPRWRRNRKARAAA
jgi:ATP-dependent RNA helicase RhlE